MDRVVFKHEGRETVVAGEVVVKAEDGGLLLLAQDGVLWTVSPEELVEQKSDRVPFAPYSRAEQSKRLLAELPQGFQVHATTHYLLCHNTSRAYAQWCGSLFERLYLAFTNYWSRRGFELQEPRFPLIALVFADHESYRRHAQAELGDAVQSIIGFYSFKTNRMTMYDLTGIQALRRPGDRRGSAIEINQMLARPEAERTVATIIHEATHQVAFNCGLQVRYSDAPLWLSEGMAVVFETPDLGTTKGWRDFGAVNPVRLNAFRQYLARRPSGSLETLLTDDKRLRNPQTANDAYAEAWALNHFLMNKRPKHYQAYLKMLATKPPLIWDKPETRLQEFRQAFGDDLTQVETEFLRHISSLR